MAVHWTFQQALALLAIGVALLVGLVLGIFLLVGLFDARSLLRREFSSYFVSPIAYVVLVVFLAVTGFSFYVTLEQLTASGPTGAEYPMQKLLGNWWSWLIFAIIPPVLTMHLFAEERSTGTLELLMTAPLRDWQVVLSKFLACFAFYLLIWVPTLLYLPVLLNLPAPAWTTWSMVMVGGVAGLALGVLLGLLPFAGIGRIIAIVLIVGGILCAGVGALGHYRNDAEHLWNLHPGIDAYPVLSTYLGLALAGAMFLALGLFISSLVRNQLVAFLVSLALGLVFIVAGFWRPDLDIGNSFYQVIAFISVPLHFSRDFCRGVVDTRHVTLYGSVALFSLFLTVRSLESRRWR